MNPTCHHRSGIAALFILLLNATISPAQETGGRVGTWNIINVKLNINDKLNLFAEPQLRSLSFYNEYHYWEFKGGISYEPVKGFTFALGTGTYNTYRPGGNFREPQLQDEIRTWLQMAMKTSAGRFRFEHRYRAEQRFTRDDYRNRFRYRLNLQVPLNSASIQPGTFYVSVWDELFFTNTSPYFERNRLFVGAGYEFTRVFALQTGYIYQFDYRINDEIGRDFYQISLLFNLDLKRSTTELIPSAGE